MSGKIPEKSIQKFVIKGCAVLCGTSFFSSEEEKQGEKLQEITTMYFVNYATLFFVLSSSIIKFT